MMPNSNAYQAYQKNKYETASPHRLIMLLYDAALLNASRATVHIQQHSIKEANHSINKTQEIVFELIACLNEEQGGEIAKNLKALYLYMINLLTKANVQKDSAPIFEMIASLKEIKSAWEQIGKEVSLGMALS